MTDANQSVINGRLSHGTWGEGLKASTENVVINMNMPRYYNPVICEYVNSSVFEHDHTPPANMPDMSTWSLWDILHFKMTAKHLETVRDQLSDQCHGKARRKQILIEQKKRRWVQKRNLVNDSHMEIQNKYKYLYKTNT